MLPKRPPVAGVAAGVLKEKVVGLAAALPKREVPAEGAAAPKRDGAAAGFAPNNDAEGLQSLKIVFKTNDYKPVEKPCVYQWKL